ncbi:hypothetical protein [Pedobacter nutrimenti]|uniref:hypothetical protein n=1 Tax=Pedobacter nutrimenti TaxID=1241337 RepID=UPI0029310822|nr:hypothetical protein [Pedobacter nutrimenti]
MLQMKGMAHYDTESTVLANESTGTQNGYTRSNSDRVYFNNERADRANECPGKN